ncbi:hypothetical protein EC973_002739 [Apophysomyces ossiformis]|uniref:Uncharacterized protein n=1 Tax=Apophysomyces ossiformis TaxID=679940 RepID=A0A8H7BY54_9FUNG|nr:hypothetical protein EC973_002739 [Apophysomyces ossiformis]
MNDLENSLDYAVRVLHTPVALHDRSATTTATNVATTTTARQSISIASSSASSIERPPRQAFLDWHLARAMFAADIPFDAIEHPLFIDFLKRLQPEYVPPKKSRLQQFLLKEQHWDLIKWGNTDSTSNPPAPQHQRHHSSSPGRSDQLSQRNQDNYSLSITADMQGAL